MPSKKHSKSHKQNLTSGISLSMIGVIGALIIMASVLVSMIYQQITQQTQLQTQPQPQVIVIQREQDQNQNLKLYPEPVRRVPGLGGIRSRQSPGPIQQIGILTGEGGSSTSASPDRTILPLFGRELDARRAKWNYYTRTDGVNPVQVPVHVGNRSCDDDRNGCNELYNNDTVHVPALSRAFKATIYTKSF